MAQLDGAVEGIRAVLAAHALGGYLYGSGTAGGLRPASDLDVLIVADRSLDDPERLALARRLGRISGPVREGRPLDVVVVLAGQLRPWRYPPIADYLYGDWIREDLLVAPRPPSAMPGLAIDLHQALAADRVLFGPSLGEFVQEVPASDLVRASRDAVAGLRGDLEQDTRNVLLTLARAWYTCVHRRVVSKDAAADWALGRLPLRLRPPLAHARHLYLTSSYADEHWPARLREQSTEVADRIAGHITMRAGR